MADAMPETYDHMGREEWLSEGEAALREPGRRRRRIADGELNRILAEGDGPDWGPSEDLVDVGSPAR